MPLPVAAKITPSRNEPKLHTVSDRAIPLPGAGGCQVAPPSELRYTPPLATPAISVPVGPEKTAWTAWLSFFGCFGSSSGPCATGCHAPPATDLKSPALVPAYAVAALV